MGAWIKVFNDGSTEKGTDSQITNNKASWSQGKLDNIKSVQIYENKFGISLVTPDTKWHQFDRFISFLGQPGQQCNRVFRAIQAQILQKHIGKYIIVSRIQLVYFVTIGDIKTDLIIKKEHVGQWLTTAISHNGKFNMRISTKGKL